MDNPAAHRQKHESLLETTMMGDRGHKKGRDRACVYSVANKKFPINTAKMLYVADPSHAGILALLSG